ncbi:MAG: FkbM family methyltransferase [Endozoicomonas sp. (ex Botrylloides leachii)]|nr:FkbM family methyltransferase [Endozoicomonas sp. (ex Botrylloides leachii)]
MRKPIANRETYESFFKVLKDEFIIKELQSRANNLNEKRGMPIAVFGNDWIGLNLNIHGLYEKEYLADLKNLLSVIGIDTANSTAIDIGANIGNHAIEFSSYFNKVICFEPNPRTFDVLEANAKQVKNIDVNNWGCASSQQYLKLQEDFNNIGGSHVSMEIEGKNYAEILVKPLDESIDSMSAVSLIKIDVEGMEIEALKGADKVISKFHPVICLEQHQSEFSQNIHETESIAWLRSKGYRIFSLCQPKSKILRRLNKLTHIAFGIKRKRKIIEFKKLPKATYPMIYAIHPLSLDK